MNTESDIRTPENQGTPTTRVSPSDLPPGYPAQSQPYQQPAQVRQRRSAGPHHVPTLGPLLLILAGGIFLLNNLGLLSWDVWGEVWKLWPLIPIAIGLDMIVGRRSPALSFVLVLGVMAAGLGLLYSGGDFETAGEVTQTPLSVPLSSAERAEVKLDFGAGDLNVSSLETGSGQLASGTLEHYGNRRSPEVNTDVEGDTLSLEIDQPSDGFRPWIWGNRHGTNWDVQLNPDVPLDLDVSAGASKVNLDLERLQLTRLSLDVGASDATVVLPSRGPSAAVDINAGAAHLTLVVPEGVAARIDVEAATASSVKVNGDHLTRGEKFFETPNFASAERKLTVKVDAGAASIDINTR